MNGWFVLQQAKDDGFDVDQISKKAFSFSHLYTALTRSSIRDFLGLEVEDLSVTPHQNPVPKDKAENLELLMSWLYGQEQKGEQTLIQSQNPNLNQLSQVLGNREAQAMLIARRDLRVAFERVEPVSTRFQDALMKSAKLCEETMSLSGYFEGDQTLLRVAEGMAKTAHSLVVVMKETAKAAKDS